jgi:phospholipid/cholesterol/gamma-HCH transport system permease protein
LVAPFQGKPLRLQGAISQAMDTGVRALPILSLITFFIGLILALQAAYELRRFGAISAVATAVAVTMSRELGPLITAIVVIGRSGSAFAAEIGTMKVSEEIDALETMAISTTPFPSMTCGHSYPSTWQLHCNTINSGHRHTEISGRLRPRTCYLTPKGGRIL